MAKKPRTLVVAPNPHAVRLAEVTAVPGALDALCAHVAQGGTVPEWAELHQVPGGLVFGWLRADPARQERYYHALADRAEYCKELIWRRVKAVAGFDIRQLLDPATGEVLPPGQWPPEAAAAVQAFEAATDRTGRKVKLADPMRALELLGKQLGMFTEKIEHSGRLTLEDLVGRPTVTVIPEETP